MLKAIHASEDLEAARKKTQDVTKKLCEMKLNKAENFGVPHTIRGGLLLGLKKSVEKASVKLLYHRAA